MTVEQHRVGTSRATPPGAVPALIETLTNGEPFAISFGGQGAPWLPTLAELVIDAALEHRMSRVVDAAESIIAPVAEYVAAARPDGFAPARWIQRFDADEAVPTDVALADFAVSAPGVLLTQLAALESARVQGLDPAQLVPIAIAGHSQGTLAADAIGASESEQVLLLALAHLIGAAATAVARRRGLAVSGAGSPMRVVAGVRPDEIAAMLDEYRCELDESELAVAPVIAITNSRTSVVVSGAPRHLRAFAARCRQRAAIDASARSRKETGGAPFDPVWDELAVSVACHHPGMESAVTLVGEWARRCGIDSTVAMRHARAILVAPVDWVSTVEGLAQAGARWIVDFGPGDLATRLAAPVVRGQGVGLVAAATRGGQRNLFSPGGTPEVARRWTDFAPTLAELPDGRRVVQTSFTRLTGRSPILLAGMTPTTVDPEIVAAAANAGHWAELAGGGQVTEEIFAGTVKSLTELLDPGRQAQFNALLLDPYLWKLQLGEKRLLQNSRAQGAPLDGVVVSAGVPDLDDAVALVHEVIDAGLRFVAFKPGTVEQIRAVIRIAAEVPHQPVIVQIEGGRAGGHHSWEDLDDLLLTTYAELRARPNVVVCVGGGIGTPERASAYLSGRWALAHGYPIMPTDGILIGTAAMAAKEATTAPEVKRLLVSTSGCDRWIGAGQSDSGMASGRSQLGADIHEINNSASVCGRLLDEVAGDDEAVTSRRAEIIAALARTAKPYFGDVDTMTYRMWLERYAELAVGGGDSAQLQWADISWAQRFLDMLHRTEARMSAQDRGSIPTIFATIDDASDAARAIGALVARYPAVERDILHPADVAFFLELCRSPGKPVNFVPVINKDVRRWWRSDSLWQAHDDRYPADAVSVIPGPVSVAGITRADEPIGELLDRFEAQIAADIADSGARPAAISTRRQRDGLPLTGLLGAVLDADDVCWGGRMVASPVVRLGSRDQWTRVADGHARHTCTGATLIARHVDAVELTIPISGAPVRVTLRVDAAIRDGGSPLVSIDDAAEAMRQILKVAAGGSLEDVIDGVASAVVTWNPDTIADHALVTGGNLPAHLHPMTSTQPHGFGVPDALVAACWPVVFSVIGAATTGDGEPVVEGLLDLVHLDHSVVLDHGIPTIAQELTVTATAGPVVDTEIGRTIAVSVRVDDGMSTIARLTERFAVRGRRGHSHITDPARAGGAVRDERSATRKTVRTAVITAPTRMNGFAAVSGDRNPIHTDQSAARLAGLGAPIVHGMWLSAAAQHLVTATDAQRPIPSPRPIIGWTARYLGMVHPEDAITVKVDRVGIDAGRDVIEVTCTVDGDLVMSASGLLAAPRTVYAFPGQGIQSKGMGLDARSRSAAARDVWDRADNHTRAALGFSILAVVRDNPTVVVANGSTYSHPDGVLFLTQFTQVAMATLGVAQIAELTEAGGFVEDAITCGHSVGEYNALAACAGVLPLEAVIEVVFQRGEAMHHLVDRDEKGRSNYRMAAIRPSQCGLADSEVTELVSEISSATGEFLEVVNFNLLRSQYAVAGTVRGLELLEEEVERRRLEFGGRRSFIVVPGIDVPFHSTVLRAGVPEFRDKLDTLLPAEIDPAVLVGRYIPNLIPRLFTLDREFVAEIAALVPSDPLDAVLADWDWYTTRPTILTRVVLIELLAWQFASPVRWIETQEMLFADPERAGLGTQRFVEIGVKGAPTLAGLAANTLKLPDYAASTSEVMNLERDWDVLVSNDSGHDPDSEQDPRDTAPVLDAPRGAHGRKVEAPARLTAGPVIAESTVGQRPDDICFGPVDAVRCVVALWTKMRTDQLGSADTIEALCDGVSSRRNQLLLDIGGELGLAAIDGAAESDLAALAVIVDDQARGYRPLGAVLGDAIGDQIRKVFGPTGKRQSYIADRVSGVWQLGPGWVWHTQVALALGTRDGVSVRGGDLGHLLEGPVTDAVTLDALVDRAVESVATAHGLVVAMPSAETGGAAMVDAAALGDFAESVTGRSGVLASAAYTVLTKLGLTDTESTPSIPDNGDALVARRVDEELGSEWARTVAPTFDPARIVVIDDRWASAREDLARLWIDADDAATTSVAQTVSRFIGAGSAVADQARWWQCKADAAGNGVHGQLYRDIARAALDDTTGQFSTDTAVVTGASKNSIAASVVAKLLAGGAIVVATTSQLDAQRLDFYKQLYRDHARGHAALWVVPANMASYRDVDDLVTWLGSEQTENLGGTTQVVKAAMTPTLLFPFAAPRVSGDLSDVGGRAEIQMKVLLWSVERLIGRLASMVTDHDLDARLHVVLAGSPNRGMFGGDGAYGESKAALDALVTRWRCESSWNSTTTLAHALIGWVVGTGLMGHNDGMVEAVEAAGVRTWTTEEMATNLLELCSPERRRAARSAAITADFTGGLDSSIDLRELATRAAETAAAAAVGHAVAPADSAAITIEALPAPARSVDTPRPVWPSIDVRPEDLVVIVGAGEVGPYGSARTRFEVEVDEKLSAAGVLELAWTTGLIHWDRAPTPGWYDTASGDPVAESEIVERYHDEVVARCGIRRYVDDGAMINNTAPLLTSVFLDEDLTFTVQSESEARSFAAADPDHTRVAADAVTGEWRVTRLAGTEIRVPRTVAMTRTVGGQIPTGFDPTRWGVSAEMVESIDRVAVWNLVATVDAFLSSGFTPTELLRWVHPGLVANTQGTGMGGMTSMRELYINTLLGEAKANDILQEALPNIVAAHVVQSYIGSYGAMVHPVAACATAAVSVEEGVDKIRLGKAMFAVAGGFDDLGIEGIVGFGDMAATAKSAELSGRGIDERRFSRANDRRRAGFVESQGGGTILLARGDVAARMGLPVMGVVGWAQSFADGVHTSIPAPGLGALGAARGSAQSPLAAALEVLGVGADDIAVISKHDTSTRANDPNEAELHERLAGAIGRSQGAPMFVVSQKSLTGHAKGGAAAFQLIGLCQVLRAGVIPPNRSLDCVDEQMREYGHLVWPREALHARDRLPLKAGLLTSLGFGHVSGLIAVVHPEAFVASLDVAERDVYRIRAAERERAGAARLLQAMCGGEPAYRRPPTRRLDPTRAEHDAEARVILNPDVRLGDSGRYRDPAQRVAELADPGRN